VQWISHVFALSSSLKLADWSRTQPSWQGSVTARDAVLCYQVLSSIVPSLSDSCSDYDVST